MKKSIFLFLLIFAGCASVSLAQTKKRSTTRATKRVVTKKGATVKTKVVKKTTIAPIKTAAVTTESGLTYMVTKRGDGAQVKAGDIIAVNYTGLFTNGQKFDSSFDRGEPLSFPVDAGRVIKGWDEGFQKLRVGDHAILTIPASIGYGSRGFGGVIPPDATLIFIVEVVEIK